MFIAIAAGGTAGHINPALALAQELESRGHEVRFYGKPDGLEAHLVPAAGFEFVPIDSSGFIRSRPWTLITMYLRMRSGAKRIESQFAQKRPDVAVGFGAYIELPLATAARRLGIPLVLHEQNSVPGMANKRLSRNAAAVCVTYPSTASIFEPLKGDATSIVVTGNPVRCEVLQATRSAGRKAFSIPENAQVLGIFGGSLGAAHLNEAVAALKEELASRSTLIVVHSTGRKNFDGVSQLLDLTPQEAKSWKLFDYIDDMGSMLAACDVVISRAGATSIAEISALGVPALLVPYPHATEDHQTTNAQFLVDSGAACVVADHNLDTEEFSEKLFDLLDNQKTRIAMRTAAKNLGAYRAASRLAEVVETSSL